VIFLTGLAWAAIVGVDLQSFFPQRPALMLALCLIWPAAARAEDSPVRIEGTFLGQGTLCPRLRLADGETISLERLPPGTTLPDPGTALHLTGRFARASRCMEGRAFLASAIAGG
jgi:hypothetical protein